MVMQDDEVPSAFPSARAESVVLVDLDRIEPAAGKQCQQPRDAYLHEMNARRLERLHEAARQTEPDAVLVPELLAPAGREAQKARLCQRPSVQIREQCRSRLVVADEAAAIHVPVANAMLQRDAPLPAGGVCRRACVGRQLATAVARHGHGAIARKPLRPFLVAGLERLLDEQALKTRAVNEQVSLQCLAAF